MPSAPFLERFEQARYGILRGEIWHGVCWVLFVVACSVGVLAAVDFWLELSWTTRAVGLVILGCIAVGAAIKLVVVPILWWSRPRTATEIERRFPQLGQRVRTVVQFSGRPESVVADEGVTPTLVTALEDDTEARSHAFDLASVYPRWKLTVAAGAAIAPILLLILAAMIDWEARLAVFRALLGDKQYTQLAVRPGDAVVDQGDGLTVSVELRGRARRRVSVYWRPADQADASWSELGLSPDDAPQRADGTIAYDTELEKLDQPTEYRAAAGPVQSDVYRIDIRYPLAVKSFDVELTPPEYTGLASRVVPGGDLEAIEGSRAEFRVELDGACSEASLALRESAAKARQGEQQPKPTSIPFELRGTKLAAELELSRNASYWIIARSGDGRHLPETKYRIRVRKDQPPSVRFEEPNEALEVHPLAEVLMRMRAGDDFGLCKAGIVFNLDNGEERTLLVRDFAAAGGVEKGDRVSPTLRTVCEEVLPLEDLELSPQQSVTYYAFAEDNYPSGSRRTETDLRFVDIRPFKRIYRVGGT
jgi:hypothetical protein